MAATATQVHHHRSTTKSDHKPFKSKHATKSALKDAAKGKVERDDRGRRRTPHQQVMSKFARRNQAKQLRTNHRERQEQESNIFQGSVGAAKHIAVVPLSEKVDVRAAINRLNEGVDATVPTEASGPVRVRVDRFKRNLLYLPTSTNLFDALDTCKLADWVVFVMVANQQFGEQEDNFLRVLENQGITSVTIAVQDLEAVVPANKRSKHLADLKTSIGHYFPGLDKLVTLENKSDCANLVRSLCTASSKGIKWRDARSWMFIDEVLWPETGMDATIGNPVISGTIRGKGLNVDRLVHVPSWGEFKIHQITQIPAQVHKRKANEMAIEEPTKQWSPSQDQDDLAELAPEQAEMIDVSSTVATTDQKGVLLDDHHYFSDDNSHLPKTPQKLPKGTSSYQAAWYLDDMSDSDSDVIDDEDQDGDMAMDDADLRPEDGAVVQGVDAMTDVPGTEYPESEMHVDADIEEEARQLKEFRDSRKIEAEEDLEFPDEIELSPNVLARERLAKYRGLKSLRTSEWNKAEDAPYEPIEYDRLLQIPDYKKSYSSVIKESYANGVPAGTRVQIELADVPLSLRNQPTPTSVYGLLRHEHKSTVVNLNITLNSTLEDPIKSKEELIVQIGHRRLVINPIFSAAGQTPNDVHKFDRFLHRGQTAIATFTGPLTWGSVPVLVFKRTKPSPSSLPEPETEMAPALIDASSSPLSSLQFVGSATTIPPSSNRIIAKRIILTGHPYKIHKKLVTIRYMFFNREDVEWFKALPLWTKRGRQGFVKEPLGTHGYFKATFDGAGKVNPMDAIGVSLYKRVWPRESRRLE